MKIENLSELAALVKIMKDNHVDKVKLGELEVTISVHIFPEETQTPKKLTDQDLISWSADN